MIRWPISSWPATGRAVLTALLWLMGCVLAQGQSAPVVSANPQDVTVNAGQSATFTATAIGTPTPSVRWQVSVNGGATFNDVVGGTMATLTIPSAAVAQNGAEYRAVFKNASGTATTTAATLTVYQLPVITGNPVSHSAIAGGNTTFGASAIGYPTPTVRWQSSSDGGATFTNIAGATATTLQLSGLTLAQDGNLYRAVFTNAAGSAPTTAATLTVTARPVITASPLDVLVAPGGNATFTATASGNPIPVPQWQASYNGGTTYTNLAGETNTTLTIANVTAAQHGTKFRAMFTNASGSATTTAATLNVAIPPELSRVTWAGGNVTLWGSNSLAGSYVLLAGTNLATPPAQWVPVMTSTLAGATSFSVTATNQISPGTAKKFFLFRTP